MKSPKEMEDLRVATELETEESLANSSAKAKLRRKVEREAKYTDKVIESNKELSIAKDRLTKAVKNERDAVALESDAAVDLADAREKVAKTYGHLNTKLQNEIKELNQGPAKKRTKKDVKADVEKQGGPLIDYSSQLGDLNKTLAEMIKFLKQKPKKPEEKPFVGPPRPPKQPTGKPKTDEPKGPKDDDEIAPTVKTAAEYKKLAEQEINKSLSMFKRITKSLQKTAKESESGAAIIRARLLGGASSAISSSIDKFISNIPVVGQVYGAGKFVKKAYDDAGENKRKRLVKERASEMRRQDQEKVRQYKYGPFPTGGKPKEDPKQNKKEEDQKSRSEKMIDILEKIRDAQILSTLFTIGGGFIKGIADVVGGGMGSLISSMKSVLGPVAGALGAWKGAKMLGGTLADGMKGAGKSTKTPPKVGNTTTSTATGGADPAKPKPDPAKGGKPKPAGKTGWFEKMTSPIKNAVKKVGVKGAAKFAAKGAARFIPFVGAALTAYEIASAFGLTDKAEQFLSESIKDMFGKEMTPEEMQEKSVKADEIHKGEGYYGQESKKPEVAPGYPSVDPDRVQYKDVAETVQRGDAQRYAQAKLEAAGQVPQSTQIEKLTDRVNEVNRQREETYRVDMQRMIRDQTIARSNINTVNSVTNNRSTTVQFNNSEYQTHHQKGSQIIR